MRIFSDFLDGYIPRHTSVNVNAYGPGTPFPFPTTRGWFSFLWWRVRAWRFQFSFSGSKQYSGTTANGNAWSYTESYAGSINEGFNISSNLFSNSGIYVRPEESITSLEIARKLFQPTPTPNGVIYSYAWDAPPPPGAPSLPIGFTDGSGLGAEFFYATGDSPNPALNVGDVYYPTFSLILTAVGASNRVGSDADTISTNIGFQDSDGANIGTVTMYRNSLDRPVNCVGNIRIETIWHQP